MPDATPVALQNPDPLAVPITGDPLTVPDDGPFAASAGGDDRSLPQPLPPQVANAGDWKLVGGSKDGEETVESTLYNTFGFTVADPNTLTGRDSTTYTVIQKITVTSFWQATNPAVADEFSAAVRKSAASVTSQKSLCFEKGEARSWSGSLTLGGQVKKVEVSGSGSYGGTKSESRTIGTNPSVTINADQYPNQDIRVDLVTKYYRVKYAYSFDVTNDVTNKGAALPAERDPVKFAQSQLVSLPTKTEEYL